MARKPLLTESEIRSFMKLAELRPIGDDKIAEMYGKMPGARDEDDMDAEDSMDDGPSMEMDLDVDDDAGDMEVDMDMGAAGDAGDKMVSIDDFMSALEGALEDVLGEPVSTEMDDAPDMGDEPEADEVEMDADVAMDAEEDEMDDPMMEEEHEDEDPPGMRKYMEEDLVNEVARRVADRLKAKNNEAQMVDALAERIMNRLTNK
tara:strand:- start:1484 stop:2095 length:612 start_codon:yes stop_codon:yes gene_type:complete